VQQRVNHEEKHHNPAPDAPKPRHTPVGELRHSYGQNFSHQIRVYTFVVGNGTESFGETPGTDLVGEHFVEGDGERLDYQRHERLLHDRSAPRHESLCQANQARCAKTISFAQDLPQHQRMRRLLTRVKCKRTRFACNPRLLAQHLISPLLKEGRDAQCTDYLRYAITRPRSHAQDTDRVGGAIRKEPLPMCRIEGPSIRGISFFMIRPPALTRMARWRCT
jgi:hypothetical protein